MDRIKCYYEKNDGCFDYCSYITGYNSGCEYVDKSVIKEMMPNEDELFKKFYRCLKNNGGGGDGRQS